MEAMRSYIDQRRYARFEVLDYAMVYPSSSSHPFRAIVVDVGLGGVQLRSREELPVGFTCELVIGDSSGKQLSLAGEVRNSRALEGQDLYGSGYRFTPKSHDERIEIAEYVHRVFQRQGEKLVSD